MPDMYQISFRTPNGVESMALADITELAALRDSVTKLLTTKDVAFPQFETPLGHGSIHAMRVPEVIFERAIKSKVTPNGQDPTRDRTPVHSQAQEIDFVLKG